MNGVFRWDSGRFAAAFWGFCDGVFGVVLWLIWVSFVVEIGAVVGAISAETEASLVHFLVGFWVCSPAFWSVDFGEERDEICCCSFGI